VAGIQLAPGSKGWQQLRFVPAVWAPSFANGSICSTLSWADASISTPRGEVSASWSCGAGITGLCNVANEHDTLHLACSGGGSIEKVTFASFGTPSGACPGGFATSSCDAKNTTKVVEAACAGKPACDLEVSDTVFGDPCFNTEKHLAVQATCTTATLFEYRLRVPVGSSAAVHLPSFGVAAGDLTVTASASGFDGALSAVFAKGAFVAGVDGVIDARFDAPSGAAVVNVASGEYKFAVSGP
jgi:hypothetical protein